MEISFQKKLDIKIKEIGSISDEKDMEISNLKSLIHPDLLQMQKDFEIEKEEMKKEFDEEFEKQKVKH